MRRSVPRWAFPFFVVLFTAIPFLPALRSQFVNWDDYQNFLLNPFYRGLHWQQMQWMFTNTAGHYIPITWMSLGLDYVIWGLNPLGYHLTSLIFHLANACLFYFISLSLISSAYPEAGETKNRALYVSAAAAALLFSIHPLRVESVVWITERRDVVAAFFLFIAFLHYLQAVRYSPSSPAYRWRLGMSLGFYALSLLSKASAVTFASVLALIDFYPLRRLGNQAGWSGPKVRYVWLEKLCYFAMALPAAWMASHSEDTFNGLVGLEKYSLNQRAAIALYGVIFYIRKTILPFALRPLYDLPASFHLGDPVFLWSAVAAILMTLIFLSTYRRWPAGFVAYGTYLAFMIPTSGFILVGPVLAADRFSYFSCLGWAILIGSIPVWAWNKWKNLSGKNWIFSGIAVLFFSVLFGLGILTRKQTLIWHDSEALWTYTLRYEPESAVAHHQMGRVFQDEEKLDLAIAEFKKAIDIIPDYALAHNNLGVALMAQGQRKEALTHFLAALKIDPRQVQVHVSLGLLLEEAGNLPEAMEQFKQAVDLNPNVFSAQVNLARTLVGLGQMKEAVPHFEQALFLEPEDMATQNDFGLTLARLGRLDEATLHFQKVLAASPLDSSARNNLGVLLLNQGKTNDAIEQFRQLLKANPQDHLAERNLNRALSEGPKSSAERCYQLGARALHEHKLDVAEKYFKRALELNPDHALANDQMGLRLLGQGQWEGAIAYFARAAHAKPPLADAENNWGVALSSKQRFAEAIPHFERALEINPQLTDAHNNLDIARRLALTQPKSGS